MDNSELQACRWMPMDEYLEFLSAPGNSRMNLLAAKLVYASLPAAAGISASRSGTGAGAGAGSTDTHRQPLILEKILPVNKKSKGGAWYYADKLGYDTDSSEPPNKKGKL